MCIEMQEDIINFSYLAMIFHNCHPSYMPKEVAKQEKDFALPCCRRYIRDRVVLCKDVHLRTQILREMLRKLN